MPCTEFFILIFSKLETFQEVKLQQKKNTNHWQNNNNDNEGVFDVYLLISKREALLTLLKITIKQNLI